jgi:hypothetical protein
VVINETYLLASSPSFELSEGEEANIDLVLEKKVPEKKCINIILILILLILIVILLPIVMTTIVFIITFMIVLLTIKIKYKRPLIKRQFKSKLSSEQKIILLRNLLELPPIVKR